MSPESPAPARRPGRPAKREAIVAAATAVFLRHGYADTTIEAIAVDYASLAVSVNWAAGLGSGDIHGEIHQSIETGMSKVRAILERALPALRARDEVIDG